MTVDQIPTLDMSRFDSDRAAFVEELGVGYAEWGFCGLVNHGISDEVIANAYQAFTAFFALPDELKQQYDLQINGGARGYTGFGVEKAKDSDDFDLKEFWHVGLELSPQHPKYKDLDPNVWVEEVVDFKIYTLALYDALNQLGSKVLQGMALYLGQKESYFADKIDVGNSLLRALHYPPIADLDTPAVRAGRHEDINLITLLVGSDEPGLEVLNRNMQWIPVTTIEGTIVCNIGDMMQRLTNHVFPSTTHRVVNPTGEARQRARYSIPFFLQPNSDFPIKTLATCISEDRPNRYPEQILADDYLNMRLREIGLLK
jgi:isopenicillin N synthase-like dioxygenase